MLTGDEQSLTALLGAYHNYLVVVGLRYLSDRSRVEDVIHDLFADLWNRGTGTEINCSVKSFLRGAVVNKCLAIIRKDQRIDLVEQFAKEPIETAQSADQLIDLKYLQQSIDQIVAALPEKCRQVYTLSRIESKSHQEIADQLGISKKTIENHMTRALRDLRNGLKRKELLITIFIFINMVILIGANSSS